MKKDIENLNFEKFPDFHLTADEAGWVLPHILAYLNDKITLVRDPSSNLILGSETFKNYLEDQTSEYKKWFGGIIEFLTQTPRGSILSGLVQGKNPEFSALVPLILSAFKKYRGVEYKEWDKNDPLFKYIVDPDLLEVFNTLPVYYSPERLLEFRKIGLKYRSGARAGTTREASAATSVNRVDDKAFDDLPKLVKVILTQIWVAHPRIRNNLMVLDLNDWDAMPEALLPEELDVAVNKMKKQEREKFDWTTL